ncbi:hypothetical protein [Roseofilum capinflatum]|uniref:Uncharacterized protein n=1 Tax=Roseofilum capinflatum BLCC-M114 TaxID=3022440 RepID=A0ABT7B791_9CYAN|nr:hypothetical protein [Roseofilum capinflatum]MDJ1174697.1 hypothetical protein [Roseofilum capinflatum BLCC-M114]
MPFKSKPNNPKCGECGRSLARNGKTKAGKTHWRCSGTKGCGASFVSEDPNPGPIILHKFNLPPGYWNGYTSAERLRIYRKWAKENASKPPVNEPSEPSASEPSESESERY